MSGVFRGEGSGVDLEGVRQGKRETVWIILLFVPEGVDATLLYLTVHMVLKYNPAPQQAFFTSLSRHEILLLNTRVKSST